MENFSSAAYLSYLRRKLEEAFLLHIILKDHQSNAVVC